MKASLTIEAKTATSVAHLESLPSEEAVLPERVRKEWLKRLVEQIGIDECDGQTRRLWDAFVTMLAVITEIQDVQVRERLRVRPKPALKIVGSHDRLLQD